MLDPKVRTHGFPVLRACDIEKSVKYAPWNAFLKKLCTELKTDYIAILIVCMITETCYITKKNIAFIYYQTFFFVECSEGSYTVGN